MKITREVLINNHACPEQMEIFDSLFPDLNGYPMTRENLTLAWQNGMFVHWIIKRVNWSGIFEWGDGTIQYFKNGSLHRDGDLPAVVWVNGDSELWENGRHIENIKFVV